MMMHDRGSLACPYRPGEDFKGRKLTNHSFLLVFASFIFAVNPQSEQKSPSSYYPDRPAKTSIIPVHKMNFFSIVCPFDAISQQKSLFQLMIWMILVKIRKSRRTQATFYSTAGPKVMRVATVHALAFPLSESRGFNRKLAVRMIQGTCAAQYDSSQLITVRDRHNSVHLKAMFIFVDALLAS